MKCAASDDFTERCIMLTLTLILPSLPARLALGCCALSSHSAFLCYVFTFLIFHEYNCWDATNRIRTHPGCFVSSHSLYGHSLPTTFWWFIFLWPDPWLLFHCWKVPIIWNRFVLCQQETINTGHKDPRLEEPGPKDLRTQGPGTRRPSLESCVALHQGIK